MSARRMTVRILGCGSSGGVPRIGGDWGVCDPANPRNRRTRCSILLTAHASGGGEATRLLIDTSPDMRDQLLAAEVQRLDAVIISHEHADQCHGIDDLRALVLRQRQRMPVYMDKRTAETLMRRFDYCFEGAGGYPAILEPHVVLTPGETIRVSGVGGAVDILPLDQDHGSIRSLGFRIANFAYCNDVVRLPEEALGRLEGLDVLVVDALRYTAHPTHANLDQALAWVERLKPRHTWLTNMHVDLDYERLRAELPPGVIPAHDGLEFDVAIQG